MRSAGGRAVTNRRPDLSRFNFVSYGRMGPGERPALTATQIEHIRRTVGRSSEVMIKVLPTGATTVRAAAAHVDYAGRKGELAIETDEGQTLQEDGVGAIIAADWALDMESEARALAPRAQQGNARLVHKLVFSMPAGTSPDRVMRATRAFCREEFALKHRYAMALHTDEPHPHVHVVVKAVSESGQRMDIRKATLRAWRESFAAQLRELGVPAHASSRQERGVSKPRLSDGRYRSIQRGASTVVQRSMANDKPGAIVPWQERNRGLVDGWMAAVEQLAQQGHAQLARDALRFARRLSDVQESPTVSTTQKTASAPGKPAKTPDVQQHVR